jgi:Lrp/AsnC family transcriptional regulator for asnA, asnC and gidA
VQEEDIFDKKDLKLIAELAENARKKFTYLAKELNISNVAVRKRLEKLEKRGVIKGYRLVVDPSALGYGAIAIVGLNVSPDKILKVTREVMRRDDIVFAAVTSGDHDVMIELWAKNTGELLKKLEELSKIDGVEKIYPAIINEVIKEYSSIPRELAKKARDG